MTVSIPGRALPIFAPQPPKLTELPIAPGNVIVERGSIDTSGLPEPGAFNNVPTAMEVTPSWQLMHIMLIPVGVPPAVSGPTVVEVDAV